MREEFLVPIPRTEQIRAVQEYLGQEASWDDAERVLEALQQRGHRVVRNMERYPYNTEIYPELSDGEFWAVVDEVLGTNCGWGINVCSDRAAFRLEYARETGEVYEVRYMCLRHTAWALELDGKGALVRVTPISSKG